MTLEQIKRHPYYPFRKFRTDDLSFLMLELYWAELFRTVLSSGEMGKHLIAGWMPQSAADRTDGNPIFHVINRSISPFRALRIIQRFNTEGLVELDLSKLEPIRFTGDAYVPFVPGLSYGATDTDGTTPIDELLISSDISEPCENLNRTFITKWCLERIPMETMRQDLDDYWKRIRENLIEVPSGQK